MADNCYVVEPLPSDNLPRTPFRRAALSRSRYNLRGPTAPRNPLGLLFLLPSLSPPFPIPAATSRVGLYFAWRFGAPLENASSPGCEPDREVQDTDVLAILFLSETFLENLLNCNPTEFPRRRNEHRLCH